MKSSTPRTGTSGGTASGRAGPGTGSRRRSTATYAIAHRALEPVGPQKLTGIVSPVVAPDGRAIAFTAMGDLWILPSGGQPMQVTNDAAVELDPAWSPDSTRLAFASDRAGHMDLWVHDLRDNGMSRLTEERGAVSGPAWSPDGNHIAFLLDHRTLTTIDLQRDQHHFVFPASTLGELGRPTWSADSNSIAVGGLFPYSNRYREGLNQIVVYSAIMNGTSSSVIDAGHSAADFRRGVRGTPEADRRPATRRHSQRPPTEVR